MNILDNEVSVVVAVHGAVASDPDLIFADPECTVAQAIAQAAKEHTILGVFTQQDGRLVPLPA